MQLQETSHKVEELNRSLGDLDGLKKKLTAENGELQRQLEEAESIFQVLLDIYEESWGAMELHTIYSVSDLARIHEKLKKYDSAGLLYQRAYRGVEYLFGPSHFVTLLFKQRLEEFEIWMDNRSQDSNSEDNDEQNTQSASSEASET